MKLSVGPVKCKDLMVAIAMAEVVATVAAERAQRVAIRCGRGHGRESAEVVPCPA